MFKRLSAAALIFAMILPLAACGNQTTLARIGAGAETAAKAFKLEVDQLCASGSLTPEKCAKLKVIAEKTTVKAKEFNGQMAAFAAITPGNVSEITLQISSFTTFLQGVLIDAGLAPNALAVRILQYAVDSLLVASIVLAGIHPPDVVAATKNTGISRKNPTLAEVKVKLPPVAGDVKAALAAAR